MAPPSREQRPTGKRDAQNAQTHTTQKKRTSNPPLKRGDGGTGTTRPGTGTASNRRKRNTPGQPNQEGRGTGEIRAQHPRPHSTAPAGKGGEQAGRAHKHAPPHRTCRRPRGTGAPAHTHPNTPQGEAGRSRNPDPSTHAHTTHRKRWGAGGARTQPHTSHMQAET